MPEDLVLQHPHVHVWTHQAFHGGALAGHVYLGPIDAFAPPVGCECGETAGDWGEVMVSLVVEGWATIPVNDIWPDGNHPTPVTAEAALKAMRLNRASSRSLGEWGVDLELSVSVAGAIARSTLWSY